MKLIKINTDHYIIVDDSEIQEGDWMYNSDREPSMLQCIGKGSLRGWQKITHSTQPLEIIKGIGENSSINYYYGTDQLSLQEVKELIGEVDVEKKAESRFGTDIGSIRGSKEYDLNTDLKRGFVKGYNQAIEDNKEKKYTEKDVRKAYDDGYSVRDAHGDRSDNMTSDEYVKSLQPKTEWEVCFADGKLKLK